MADSIQLRKAYIRYLLIANDSSQRHVADKADVSYSTVARTIAGERNGEKSDRVWKALSKITGRSISELTHPPKRIPSD